MVEVQPLLRFYAISDWGQSSPSPLGAAMASYARQSGLPAFILALGDNFYPSGVASVRDSQFQRTWADQFLNHPELRCPWHLVLGNHDYYQDPDAQIDFTECDQNPDHIWNMPARNYQFTTSGADFFALDTNGVQGSVRRVCATAQNDLFEYISELETRLAASSATWKFVFAHHPMYTRGFHHGTVGRCLRDSVYTLRDKYGLSDPVEYRGYSLESKLRAFAPIIYLSGHEHAMQHHQTPGIHHFVVGAANEYAFYGGEDQSQPIDWIDRTKSRGFLAVEVFADTVVCRFISYHHFAEIGVSIVKEVWISKP